VKIDPKSIGVGQYQHDLAEGRLSRSLDAVVEDCVNAVGVDVNTASVPLLRRVSPVPLRAAAFAPKPDAKAFDQARTVTLLGDGDKVLAKVRIGALTKDGNRRYASSDGQPRIAEVDKGTVEDLPKSLDELLEPPAAATPDAASPTRAAK